MTTDPTPTATAHFVESIPTGMDDLRGSESTAEALIRLVGAARATIDLTAMYWALIPNRDPGGDEEGWTVDELAALGADRGDALLAALDAAAARGVRLRVIESPGFDGSVPESAALGANHPEQVSIRQVHTPDWYGTGIMHQKIWVFDGRAVYLGSANMDWKSMTQVKEIGVVVEDSPDVAAEVGQYFDTWWDFAGLDAEGRTAEVFDTTNQVQRRVPSWSTLVPEAARADNPLETKQAYGQYPFEAPLSAGLGGEEGAVALSGAPAELCTGRRTFDQDMLTSTIADACSSVCISVMDFAPVSLYLAAPVWWPPLVDGLLSALSPRQLTVRLMVSEWEHTSGLLAPYLDALAGTAQAAFAASGLSPGKLEIRRFRVPGWRSTGPRVGGQTPRFPGHTRVNHTKYIVTDRRINVGTSNMTYDYFSGTAGASFNATHPTLVAQLQAIFDRDWDSAYCWPIQG